MPRKAARRRLRCRPCGVALCRDVMVFFWFVCDVCGSARGGTGRVSTCVSQAGGSGSGSRPLFFFFFTRGSRQTSTHDSWHQQVPPASLSVVILARGARSPVDLKRRSRRNRV
eukprot:2609882-Prymnesium_polylepis.1